MHPTSYSNQPMLSKEASEEVAIKALTFLSQDTDLLGRFLALSGLSPDQLRDCLSEPSFMAAILEFILSDDALILTFASNNNLDPNDVVKAKARLDPMASATTGAL